MVILERPFIQRIRRMKVRCILYFSSFIRLFFMRQMINCGAFFIEEKWHRAMLNMGERGKTCMKLHWKLIQTHSERTNERTSEHANERPAENAERERDEVWTHTKKKWASVWWRVNIANIATTLAEANEITGIKNIFLLIMGLAWHIQFGLFRFISFQCFLSFFLFLPFRFFPLLRA